MRRAAIASVLLLLCSAFLGATVFREQVAQAAQAILPVRVVNTPAEAVPVSQQGTVDVSLRNSVPVTEGGSAVLMHPGTHETGSTTATALSIRLTAGVNFLALRGPNGSSALFYGPAYDGNADIVLALTRPITFDTLQCSGEETARCSISWVGAEP